MEQEPREEQPAGGDSLPSWREELSGPAAGWRYLLRLARSRYTWIAAAVAILLVAGYLVVHRSGDDGTTQKTAADKAKSDGKRPDEGPKDPFQFGVFTIRPSEAQRVEAGIKPGHWTTASLEARANFADFRGELVAELMGAGGPVDLDGLPYRLRSQRPAILAKGQKKTLDVALFDPVQHTSRQAAPRLLSAGGRDVWNSRELLSPMPPQQFFLVALARQPDDYRYLHTLDSIWAPLGTMDDRGAQSHYRVVLPTLATSAPLPAEVTYWTSTAVVLWDGIDPQLLAPDQQRALVDWLHWGGQLIVSGPDSLELLRGTFLEPYLPATSRQTLELTEDALAPLARFAAGEPRLRLSQPWTGEELAPHADASVVAATEQQQPLIVERAVGRGRAVLTAFRLSQRDLVNWPGYDGLFNACLLRRQSRQFVSSPEFSVAVQWTDGTAADPAKNSRLRFFTRSAPASSQPVALAVQQQMMRQERGIAAGRAYFPAGSTEEDPLGLAPSGPGAAGWDDESPASNEARAALRQSAGIQVPNRMFVLYVLGAYVFVLVPLNWLVFRSLGRVELAWIAAPVVAIVFAGLVIKMAQLNIGFARSQTEIAVLEIQGSYHRAHLTRYYALYTSLSTDYTLEFADPAAVALPFRTGTDLLLRQSRSTVLLRRQPESAATGVAPVSLEQIEVSSNSTGMVHSEEMFDLEGPIQLERLAADRYRIKNKTSLRLRSATVVAGAATAAGVRSAWLGTLEPGAAAEFALASNSRPESEESREDSNESLRSLMQLATSDTAPDELRLVAHVDEELPGVSVTPVASQKHHGTVVVAHLAHRQSAVQLDVNSRRAIAETIRDQHNIDSEEEAIPGVDPSPTSPARVIP
ncbi:MAG: hypothetical protein HYX69_00635 [Planctomycetia bacterium]|nr:hypothetical protein [Planctomycetia bacterium]